MRQSIIFILFLLMSLSVPAQSPGIWKQTGVRVNQTDLKAAKARCLPHCSFTGHADEDGMEFRYSYLGSDGKTHVHSGHVRFDWQSTQGLGSLIPGETVRVTAVVTNTADIGYVSGYVVAGLAGFMNPRKGSALEAPAHGSTVMEGSFVVPSGPSRKPDGSLIPWDVTFVLHGGNDSRHIERIITYTWQAVTGQTGQEPAATSPQLKTNRTAFRQGDAITVEFAGLPGNPRDWIGIYRSGTDGRSYLSWQYTGGKREGRLTFNAPADGEYILIAYENDGYRELGRSGTVRVGHGTPSGPVGSGVQPGGAGVRTLKSEYRIGEPITVEFNGISGYPKDWIAIYGATAHHANEYIEWKYTEGRKDGTMTFNSPRYGAGSYKIRIYENDGYKILAESPEFRVVN